MNTEIKTAEEIFSFSDYVSNPECNYAYILKKMEEYAKHNKDDRIDKAIEWCEAFEVDPYPEDIFPPLSKDELRSIHTMLIKTFNISLDRLAAHTGRRIIKPIQKKATEMKEILQSK